LKGEKTANILDGKGKHKLRTKEGLVEYLYLSFDTGENNHFFAFKQNFYPSFTSMMPQMINLREIDFDITECNYSAFRTMTGGNITYPSSLTTVRMISVDTDFHKVSHRIMLYYKLKEHKGLHRSAPQQMNIRNKATIVAPIWNSARWGSGIEQFCAATKLEIVMHKFLDSLLEEGVVEHNHPLIHGLEKTQVKEIHVWHGVKTVGKSKELITQPCKPACKVEFFRGNDDEWTSMLAEDGEHADEKDLEAKGWKIVKSRRY
jgi:hypothetical protein